MALTLTQAQRLLLGIISSVEAGMTTPKEAVAELKKLKSDAEKAGLNFRASYTEEEFQQIRKVAVSTYDPSQPEDDSTPFESSESSY